MDLFAAISHHLYAVGADVAAIGPESARLVRDKLGFELPGRLMAMEADLRRIKEALDSVRADFVAAELARNSLTADSTNLKLHLGCGPRHLPEWVNIDVAPAPLRLNLLWGLPFKDESVQYVFLSHVLEHFYYPNDALSLLTEIRRVLAPGGAVRIIVPDIEKCMRAYYERDDAFFETRKKFWPWAQRCDTPLEHFLEYAGANQRPEFIWDAHKYGYDLETMSLLLKQAGFSSVKRSDYMASEHAELRVDNQSVFAEFRDGEDYYSLFVEATR